MKLNRTLQDALGRFGEARRRHRDYQKLCAMDDRLLNDIGLTRGDVAARFLSGRRKG